MYMQKVIGALLLLKHVSLSLKACDIFGKVFKIVGNGVDL